MTLVGPRPCLEWEAEMFPSEFDERFAVRPGMTGLWQVSGRSTMGTLDMLRLDVHYVRHQTLRGDVAILARTVPRCCAGTVPDEYGDRGQPDEYGDRGQPDGGCRSSYRSPLARARGDGGKACSLRRPGSDRCATPAGSHRRRGSSPMPPDVRPTASWVPISDIRGDRLVSLPFSDRAEPLVADRATWSSLVDDALRTDARLQIRCLDAAVPTTDTRLVRAGEAVAFTTLGAPVPEIYRSPGLPPGGTGHRGPERRARRRGHRDGRRHHCHRLHVSLRKYKFRLLAQPFALFERIWQEFAVHDGIVTLLAHVNGEPVAGAVYLAWNDVLYYKFGASLPRTLPLRPNDALAWTALRWASERGFRLLDWGLSDLDQPGLSRTSASGPARSGGS